MKPLDLKRLEKISQGKVRDMFFLDEDHVLMVTSDRLSAYDVVFNQTLPGKGKLLNEFSVYWCNLTQDIVPNHLSGVEASQFGSVNNASTGDALVCRRATPLRIEAVVRGYLAGSGWREYQQKGSISGVPLPGGMSRYQVLSEPIFTPASKATLGLHDENISKQKAIQTIGGAIVEEVERVSLMLYHFANKHVQKRGFTIADTKFEFGLDRRGNLMLIDEVLTPDSSRFWGHPIKDGIPKSYDKQYIRDALDASKWNKQRPAPMLPQALIDEAMLRYRRLGEALWCN